MLVTLVRAEGSSYGGRELVCCWVIGESMRGQSVAAAWRRRLCARRRGWSAKGAVVERYSTMFDDTAEVPFGLGCGGVVDLLLEPADTAELQALMAAMERSLAGEDVTVLTWLPSESRALARAVLSSSGDFLFASAGLTEPELVDARAGVLRRGWVENMPEGIFVERIVGPQRLFVLGAGDDAKAAGEHGCAAGVERDGDGWAGAFGSGRAISRGRTCDGISVWLRRFAGDSAGGCCGADDA